MPRRKAPLQVNQFSKGLYTELNPLETNLETTSDELNMDLNRDGSRSKRLGFDFEQDHITIDSGVPFSGFQELATTTHRWENAGGDSEKILLAVQVGNSLKFFDFDNTPVSSEVLYTKTFDSELYNQKFSYAVVDGLLVVVTSEKSVYVFEYDNSNNTISESEEALLIRDLFGVQALQNGVDLTVSQNLEIRPEGMSNRHRYNLRNQGWNYSIRNGNTETIQDPLRSFYQASLLWPSNSELISREVYPDANDTDNRLVDRFFASNLVQTRAGSGKDPQGFFIIDALSRGASRTLNYGNLLIRDPVLEFPLSLDLPQDETPGGASVIEEFAGRVWYAGFSGEVRGGDTKSPRMSSYLLFSSLVKDKTDVGRCYQQADPTSKEDAALVGTDGGFVRLEGAYGIRELISLRSSLFVFAENGVWRVTGSGDAPFTATSYEVSRVTRSGCVTGKSVVVAEDTIFYWGEDSLYAVRRNEFGEWVVVSLTDNVINTIYNSILRAEKVTVQGYYDRFLKQVRWVYNNLTELGSDGSNGSSELILDLVFQAFIKNKVDVASGQLPLVRSVVETSSYSLGSSVEEDEVIDSSGSVVQDASLEDVVVDVTTRGTTFSNSLYLVVSGTDPNIEYSFGTYSNTDFYDWDKLSRTSYEAYLLTNPLTAGEPRSSKQVPYLQTFFKRTEEGFDVNLAPARQSSCLLSVRWAWANSTISGKWSTPRQAYRYTRTYIPAVGSDPFDTGYSIIHTRNRMRGSGESAQFRFEAEEGKDLYLYGWAFNLTAANED